MLTLIAILWVVVWVFVVVDIIRRPQFSTVKKVAWALIVLIFPIVGVLVYLVVRPPDISDRMGSAADVAARGAHARRAPGLSHSAASCSGERPSRPSVASVRLPSARKSRASTTDATVIRASIAGVGTSRRAARSEKNTSP